MCAPNKPSDTSIVSGAFVTASIVAATFYFIRWIVKGVKFNENSANAFDKISIVTNVTKAKEIGQQVALELNKRGALVYMLCESEQEGNLIKQLLSDQGADIRRLFVKVVHLKNLDSVRQFGKHINDELDSLDILVNNTDTMMSVDEKLVNREARMGNLGHFLLTELLLPLLKKSQNGGRIVVAASELLDADRLETSGKRAKQSHWTQSYQKTRQANTSYAQALTNCLRESDALNVNVTVNACYPGAVFENFSKAILPAHPSIRQIIVPFFRIFTKTAEEGMQSILFLALSEKVKYISGRYFEECEVQRSPRSALDDSITSNYYNLCRKAVGL